MDGYQALYRRYRSQRFVEVRGQDHVVKALRNAVRGDRVSHAYLFSGPRGTGKTSTARILAKALNCENVVDGDPCGVCDSCRAIEHGTSFDVFELDAASNNGVDDIRELIDRSAHTTPGRRKVYILDEVHMLSRAASNALLKTLEEPPEHVVFVLATTDPQKVEATIRSRTQHLQFHLLAADVLRDHLTAVAKDAGIDLPPGAIEHALQVGAGSARDALSALDQIISAGGLPEEGAPLDEIVEALIEGDPARALASVASSVAAGSEARGLASRLIAHLRDVFLAAMAPDVLDVPDTARARIVDQASRLGAAALVRAMETLGTALVDMRNAPDPRVLLEVALVRLTSPRVDDTTAALADRLERLERAIAAGASAGEHGAAAPAVPRPSTPGGRTPLGAHRGAAPATPAAASPTTASPAVPTAAPTGSSPTPPAPARPAPNAPAASGALPTRDELTLAWADHVLPRLRPGVKALYAAGRFLEPDAGSATALMAVPNAPHRDRCERARSEVEAALAAHFGQAVPLRLVVDTGATAAPTSTARASAAPDPIGDDDVDLTSLTDAPAAGQGGIDRIVDAFPGAQLLTEDS